MVTVYTATSHISLDLDFYSILESRYAVPLCGPANYPQLSSLSAGGTRNEIHV